MVRFITNGAQGNYYFSGEDKRRPEKRLDRPGYDDKISVKCDLWNESYWAVFFLVVLFIMLYKTGTKFWTIQIKAPD